jgi:Tol biopolymer transport system component
MSAVNVEATEGMSADFTPGGAGSVNVRASWLALLVGTWLVGGLTVVTWAMNQGLTDDAGFSPYHIPAYLCLVALGVLSLILVGRAFRQGRPWREAFPQGFGSLGAGLVAILAALALDVGWREGVGIGRGIESWFAPSRILLAVGILLIVVTPLRAALRSADAKTGRWPAVLGVGLAVALLGGGGFHPAENPWLEQVPIDPKGEIWAMDADGAHQTRLIPSSNGFQSWNAVWSPDGSQFAFTRLVQGSHPPIFRPPEDADIWVAAADGTQARSVVTRPGWQWLPHWSPDGRWLVYTDEPEGGPWAVSGPSGPLGGLLGPGSLAGGSTPVRQGADIWRVRADGTSLPERLTDAPGAERAASYSPDGSQLVFDSTRDKNTEVYIMDADGSNQRQLTWSDASSEGVAADWGATFSPDGTQIAFNSGRTGDFEIWVMGVDGRGLTRIGHDPGVNDIEPSFSADGSRITYRRWIDGAPPTEGNEIWSMAADGTDSRNLSRSVQDEDLPSGGGAWAADGRILYTRTPVLPVSAAPEVREGLGGAAMLVVAILLSLAAVVVRVGPPFGAFAVIMGGSTALVAAQGNDWRFVPVAVVGGLIVDLLVRYAPRRRKAQVAGAGMSAAFVLAAGITVGATSELGWSPTLLLGVAFASAAVGWAIGGLMQRPLEAEGGSPR